MEQTQHKNSLLVFTLKNIWHNYLKTTAEIEDVYVKQHWVELFLFHFQYVNEEILQQPEFTSFFHTIPEEICSFLLEQVYEIISKSDLYTPEKRRINTKTRDAEQSEGSAGKNKELTKLLRKNHNFAQLILSAPSDCSKIVALRTFLTHQLGQHLLEFLLNVNTKHIASQKSLCNLCINLFPNCPWDDSNEQLPLPTSIYEFVGNLNLYEKSQTKSATNSENYNSTISSTLYIGPDSALFYTNYTNFKNASRTSDEIAYILIKLLTKCVANECETMLNDQSMSVISLNFALDCLCINNAAFGAQQQNANIVKCALLHLTELCLNNLFANVDNINAIQYQYVFAKLIAALQSNRSIHISNDASDSSITAATAVTSTICTNEQIVYALNFIIFGILHNVIAMYTNNPTISNNKNNLYTMKFIDETVIDACMTTTKQLLLQETAQLELECISGTGANVELQLLFTNTFKLLLKIIDNLWKYDQLIMSNGSQINGMLLHQQQVQQQPHPKPRRKKFNRTQMHCGMQMQTLTCYFQGVLLNLLPNLNLELQEFALRYLLRSGTCCCHYTLPTYELLLQIACNVTLNYQKCIYKILNHKFLQSVFMRSSSDTSSVQNNKKQPLQCNKCDAKLKSLDFHAGILNLYRRHSDELNTHSEQMPILQTFLKHLKHIAHLLTNIIAAGILAEIVLPIFRTYKSNLLASQKTENETKPFWNSRSSSTANNHTPNSSTENSAKASTSPPPSPKSPALAEHQTKPRLQLHIKHEPSTGTFLTTSTEITQDNFLKILHECLNVFIIYLSDIRVIKAFYNEENIRHLEDLLKEPELIRCICDLIKIGIDNITFLGDNSQEQIVLSRRLITLQLNNSDYASQIFTALLKRVQKSVPDSSKFCTLYNEPKVEYKAIAENMKPLDILHITTLQWTLNCELLKTSQYFYNEFAKLYSIVTDEDETTESQAASATTLSEDIQRKCLKRGDKTIGDILRLNYNALNCFLMLPKKQIMQKQQQQPQMSSEQEHIYTFSPSSSMNSSTNTNNVVPSSANKAIDCCYSSSLETLFSSLDVNNVATARRKSQQQSLSSAATAATTATAIDSIVSASSLESETYDSIAKKYYIEINSETFLQKLKLQEQPLYESIVLFDIRNHIQSNATQNELLTTSSSSAWSILSATTNLVDSKTDEVVANNNEGVIAKLFGMFGTFLFGSGSGSNSINNLNDPKDCSARVIDEDLLCFYETNSDYKKLLLKLFEATMAICIKGYQNEEVEKMQRHLRKLKAIILGNATTNWEQYSEEHTHTHDNAILQTLQTLLKIAELSNAINEPVAVVSNSTLTAGTDDAITANTNLRSRARSFNSARTTLGAGVFQYRSSHQHQLEPQQQQSHSNNLLSTKANLITPPTPQQQLSSENATDGDYFSLRTSVICAGDSEVELSENDNEEEEADITLTGDDGYEADGEIPELSDSEAEVQTADLWNTYQPTSRYRTHILHDGLCRLVVDILIELSHLCTQNPVGWSDSLAQLVNRLFVIREYLGGSLFLLRGFAPVLACNDVRLKELQQSILELIVDLNTPDVLCTYFNILASNQPPMDLLIKYMSYICTSTLKKAQPSIELEFPIVIDGKCISTSNVGVTEQIERVRNYHLYCQANTVFTRSPCIIPITHVRLWNNDGVTLSLWVQFKSSQMHKGASSQLFEDDVRCSNEEPMKSHIVSIGTNQAMLSIYVNSNMNLVFETCKPNAEIQTRAAPTAPPETTSSEAQADDGNSNATVINTAYPTDGRIKRNRSQNSNACNTSSTTSSHTPFRNALKQTKLVLLNSFNNMQLFNGHPEGDSAYEGSCIDLKYYRMPKNKWTHLTIAIDLQADHMDLTIYINGLEQHTISLSFRNLRNLIRTHVFQMISLGDGVILKSPNNTNSYTESRSTLNGCPMRLSICNLLLFNRKISQKEAIFNLTAMGPDFTELTQCHVANWKPNYGYLNLNKMPTPNFGNFTECLKLLKDARILTYAAQQPDIVMGFDPNMELDNASYGRPYGLILYGQLIQNQLQSLQTATLLCGGLSTLLFMFARVVEVSSISATQSMALDIFLNVALSESQLYAEFLRNDYLKLIGYVIKTERCTKDVQLLKVLVNNACSQPLINKKSETLQINENTIATLVYPRLLVFVLHRYSDWHRSGAEHSEVLDMIFLCILALTRDKHPHRDFNMEQLNKAGLVKELLNLCKVYVIESPNPVYISRQAAIYFASILSIFAGSPPSPSLMDEIMKLLLLLHKPSECYITHDRSKFYFLLSSQRPVKEKSLTAANLSRVAAPFRRNFGRERPNAAAAGNLNELDANRVARINRLRNLHKRNSAYKRALNEFEENLENVADCSKLNKGALRLLSPVEVSKWRSKFKHLSNLSERSSPKNNNSSSKFLDDKLSSISPNSSMQQKTTRKRLRLHTFTNSTTRSPMHGSAKRRLRRTLINSESNLNTLNASLAAFDDAYGASDSLNDVFCSTPIQQRRSKTFVKTTDFYSSLGIITLQERLLTLLKDFLCLLPDNTVEEVLKHYIKVEFLLVLSNHSCCAVRAAIIKLLAALTKRLSQHDLQICFKNFYPQHLANQLSIYPTDVRMFEICLEWVCGIYGNMETVLNTSGVRIQQRFGLNTLLAITTKILAIQNEGAEKVFQVLRRIYLADVEEQQTLIEAGLLQCCMKALLYLHTKQTVFNSKAEEYLMDLLTTIGEISIKSAGRINIVWDILNMLSYCQERQSAAVGKAFRAAQGQLQLNWINMFFAKTNVPWSFKVIQLPGSTLTMAETKTRLDLLIDRCTQFFTVFDASYKPSDNEITLFQLLVSYGISSNQRCNNFIAWGLQPSRPRDLRAFIVDALWISCHDDFLPSIICDSKMIKSLLWLCMLEDLQRPIENLERLCKRLNINENDAAWNLENDLDRIELNRSTVSAAQKTYLDKTIYKFESLAVNCIDSSMLTTRRVAELQNAERKIIMSHMKDYDETATYTKWLEIVRRMTHEGAPWYCRQRAENSWELDDTEGPSRVHSRLRRCHLDMDSRFKMEDYHSPGATKNNDNSLTRTNDGYTRPLDYLITSYDQQLNISLNSQILYNFPAKYLPVDGEIDGEIIVTDHKLYFLATYRCKFFYVSCDIANITEIWLKRYQHQEKAFEIFLDTNQSLFFSLHNQDDWKIMRDIFCDKIVAQPDAAKVLLITQQWREGLLTNWEYLMTLNQISGRTYNDLMQYPVFPWILSNYKTDILDLTDTGNFRKLEKPIAVQHEDNEQHYINNYTYIDNTMTNMGSMVLKPYHYSSHYSNSGTVLHFLVRVPPFTSYFLRYQDNNFDLPDRTFHALSTTWCLASRDSPTDVKELIPEFFCLPEMFENFERFNFGCRQSGERVEDVNLPPWCLKDARLFILIHRQALESELVRNNLHQWIDLIFGFKQSGDSAVEAINVFHPATYATFLESVICDPIERKAVETMVKTYGQMPRQLFKSPHPASKALNYCLIGKEILSSVRGLRWGVYLGSPQLPKPMLGNIHKLPGADYLISFNNTNVVYGMPVKSCIMQGAETDIFNVISWGYDDRIVRIQPLNKMQAKPKNLLHNSTFDDITACGTDSNSNQLWFGHKSGRISVYKCGSVESNNRPAKSRQSYVRGLRFSYNSAFRKITTKSSGLKMDTDDADTTSLTLSSSSATAQPDAAQLRDGADLSWSGPTVLIRHADEITCISLSMEFKIAVSADRDGITVIWDLNNWSYIRTIERPAEIHHSPITVIAISPTLGDIVTVHSLPRHNGNECNDNNAGSHNEQAPAQSRASPQPADECFEVTEESLDDFVNVSINPNGKSILRLHTVNARYIQHIVHEDRILAACYSYIKEGVGVNVIATAVQGGIVRIWSSWNLSFVSEIVTGISNIKSITYSTHQHLVVLTKESHIQVWETDGLYGSAPKFPQIAYK